MSNPRPVALRLPDHLREAIHHVVARVVHRAAPLCERPSTANADSGGWSIDTCSSMARCIGKMQEGIGLAALGLPVAIEVALRSAVRDIQVLGVPVL